jgi:predicted  nucleic acid-binding Zn-ribbon protein
MAEETKVADNAEMKFTEEELQSLQTLQTNYQEKQAVLGQLAVQRILLDQQSKALEARVTEVEQDYQNVQQEERDLVAELNQKYGPGQLNPETGVFTPTNQ